MRALVVDGYPLMRQAVKRELGEERLEVDTSPDYDQTLLLLRERSYDIAIIEVCYPSGAGGFAILEKILEKSPDCKVIFYTSAGPKLLAQKALQAGAVAYLHKSERIEVLNDAIVAVLQGEVFLSDELAQRVMMQLRRGYEPDDDPVDDLSPREWQVWQRLAKGWTCQQIADELCLSIKTIQTYCQHIKDKASIDRISKIRTEAAAYMLTGGRDG